MEKLKELPRAFGSALSSPVAVAVSVGGEYVLYSSYAQVD